MYSVAAYGHMIADRVRMRAYEQALRQTVHPGAVVMDIGTGTGIMAMLACQFGARRVYAIEPDGVIEVAREIAQANGFADRIVFLQDVSTRVTLPERADVIVSDLRGVLPLFDHNLKSVADARRRFLKPGGVLIPQCDTLWAAVVEAPKLYGSFTAGFAGDGYGLDMAAALRLVTNNVEKGRVKPEELLTEPQRWATLDYGTLEAFNARAEVTWNVARLGTGHGLSVWFDATLAEGITFSNGPDAPELLYNSAFFPWTEPVTLAAGDRVDVSLSADRVGEDYVWRWETRIWKGLPKPQPIVSYQQSTFLGTPLTLASLGKREAGHVPTLDEDGEIDRFILARMDGRTAQQEIARDTAARFPARFARWEDALTRVGDLSQKYGR